MLRETVRGFVTVASGVAEEVGKRVVLTAAELLERSGIDLAEVERKARAAGQFPPSVRSLQTLAEEAVTAGRAGLDLAAGVARSEVEKAFEMVGDQVTKVGVVLAYLESRLREVEEESASAPQSSGRSAAARADGLFGHGWETDGGDRDGDAQPAEPIVAERVEVDDSGPGQPAVPERAAGEPVADGPAGKQTAPKHAQAKTSAAKKAAVNGATAKSATAKSATAKKATAKKAPVKEPAREPAARKAATKKTAVKKTTVTRSVAAAEQPTAKKAAPANGTAKRAATKRTTTVRRTTSSKGPDA